MGVFREVECVVGTAQRALELTQVRVDCLELRQLDAGFAPGDRSLVLGAQELRSAKAPQPVDHQQRMRPPSIRLPRRVAGRRHERWRRMQFRTCPAESQRPSIKDAATVEVNILHLTASTRRQRQFHPRRSQAVPSDPVADILLGAPPAREKKNGSAPCES